MNQIFSLLLNRLSFLYTFLSFRNMQKTQKKEKQWSLKIKKNFSENLSRAAFNSADNSYHHRPASHSNAAWRHRRCLIYK